MAVGDEAGHESCLDDCSNSFGLGCAGGDGEYSGDGGEFSGADGQASFGEIGSDELTLLIDAPVGTLAPVRF
jgi:hypothetical protein